MTEEPRSLTLQRKTIPLHVESAVLTALEKLPADRFASAAEFSAALSDTSAATLHRTTGRSAVAPRRRSLAWAPWVVAVAGVGIGAWAWMHARAAAERPVERH